MSHVSRRTFLKTAAVGAAGIALSARSRSQVAGANGEVRVAIVGLNGRGQAHLKSFAALPGVRVVALCDVDSAVLAQSAATAHDLGATVEKFSDLRELLAHPGVDAITIATPNHQHSLQAIWALQAGKDVFVEKPVSHNIWEGRQLVAAAAKSGRIVQAGTQNRSSPAIAEAIAWVRAGNIGRITASRGLCYKRRASIGKTTGPQPVPATVNYDLWLGPAPLAPLRRLHLHYDWHWQWPTGNGDIGNQGIHQVDIARRFLDEAGLPPRVFSLGGRFGYEDDGNTPNTQVAVLDYAAAPMIFEVRGLPAKPDALSGAPGGAATGADAAEAAAKSMDRYRGLAVGNIVECEGGYIAVPAADYSSAQAFDRAGRLLREFKGLTSHFANFIDAVRSRKPADVHAPVSEGHVSSALCHLANISHRTGHNLTRGAIREKVAGQPALAEAFGRMSEHLAANGLDLEKIPATLGLPLTLDVAAERFTGPDAAPANALLTRDYRAPFVVPQMT